jgi:hypothetical protein
MKVQQQVSTHTALGELELGFPPNRLLKFGFSQLYLAFETGSVVLVECH